MNIRIVFAITGFLLLCGKELRAQIPTYAEEALAISRIRPGGSARIQGMGGVQNSLGGDVSSAYYNPAGLGMYNRSDFSFTPAYVIANTSSSYLGNNTSENKNSLIVPNFGIAFHTSKDGTKGLWGGTFAINFNRTNDFNNTFSYQGTNKDNSLVDYFLADANGTGTSQFNSITGYNYNTPTGLAYNNYIIGPQSILSPTGDSTKYFTDVTGIPIQKETVKNSGAQNQWSFSYGANFNDKIFVGGGIGLTTFKYKSQTTYTEAFSDPNQPMSSMQLDETLSLSGSGINATIGTIIRPVDEFQFGISIATPTSYLITDNYNATMSTSWKNFTYQPGVVLNDEHYETDLVTSNYNLSTPWRFSGGATFFIQKHGFISADAEWLNYSTTNYSSTTPGVSYSADNGEIKSLYKSTLNIRVGGEYRLDNYRFRAGYSMMPDPFQTQQNGVDRSLTSYSVGLGYRTTSFYVDMAVVLAQGNGSYRPYRVNSPTSPLVMLNNTSTSIMFTIGIPF